MKKIAFTLLATLMLLSLLSPGLLANASSADRLDLVTDVAGVLSQGQWEELNQWAEDLTEEYKIDVIVLVVEEIEGDDPEEYAWGIFDYYGMGYGTDKSTVMLMLATVSRKVSIVAQGIGNDAFTDYGKDTILDDFLVPQLRNNNWVAAVYAFMEKAEEYLALNAAGKPVDIWIPGGNEGPGTGGTGSGGPVQEDKTLATIATIAIPIAVALILCQAWVGQMKTAVKQRAANLYITAAGLQLTEQTDTFSHRTETRRTIPTSSNSSSSGRSGGTTTSSSGRSGSSRSF